MHLAGKVYKALMTKNMTPRKRCAGAVPKNNIGKILANGVTLREADSIGMGLPLGPGVDFGMMQLLRRYTVVVVITLIAHVHVVTLACYAFPFILARLPMWHVCGHFAGLSLCCGAIILVSPHLKKAAARRQYGSPMAKPQDFDAVPKITSMLGPVEFVVLTAAMAAPVIGCLVVIRNAATALAGAPTTTASARVHRDFAGNNLRLDVVEVRAALAWVCAVAVHYAYIACTYPGQPEISGCRDVCGPSPRRPRLAAWMTHLSREVGAYFHGRVLPTTVLADPPLVATDAREEGPFIFGFHPHGVLPLTTLWLRLCPQWQAVAPDFTLLTASVMHYIPVMRDLLQWLGARDVSHISIARALNEGRSVMLIPGGQAEMLESQSGTNKLRLVTSNTKWLQIAIEQGAAVVPVISFGETEILDNVRIPWFQRWCVRRFGLPVLHLPHGALGLPFPRPRPVTVCVGTPIRPPQLAPGEQPTKDMVAGLHREYYRAVTALFHARRAEAGFAKMELDLLG